MNSLRINNLTAKMDLFWKNCSYQDSIPEPQASEKALNGDIGFSYQDYENK